MDMIQLSVYKREIGHLNDLHFSLFKHDAEFFDAGVKACFHFRQPRLRDDNSEH